MTKIQEIKMEEKKTFFSDIHKLNNKRTHRVALLPKYRRRVFSESNFECLYIAHGPFRATKSENGNPITSRSLLFFYEINNKFSREKVNTNFGQKNFNYT